MRAAASPSRQGRTGPRLLSPYPFTVQVAPAQVPKAEEPVVEQRPEDAGEEVRGRLDVAAMLVAVRDQAH
jgi:hypothetical protein